LPRHWKDGQAAEENLAASLLVREILLENLPLVDPVRYPRIHKHMRNWLKACELQIAAKGEYRWQEHGPS
jgi:hypothetical protein